MNLDKSTLLKIRDIKILDVARKFELPLTKQGSWYFTQCFCHDDHSPSLGIKPSKNHWCCFSCGEKGDHITLVMKHEKLDFKGACEWLMREFNIPIPQDEVRKNLIEAIKDKIMNYENTNTNYLNSSLLESFKGTSNEFTRALMNSRILTMQQMQHAAEVYHIGTANEGVVFWQIDDQNNIREGKVMFYEADGHRSQSRKPVSVSWILKHEKQLPEDWRASHCLFGLHLLASNPHANIAIVESEKTAIICSELMAQKCFIWLATGGKGNLTVEALRPLVGRKVIIFPDTDPNGSTYQDWKGVAKEACEKLGQCFTVSNVLEVHATPEQKERKIDVADFLVE